MSAHVTVVATARPLSAATLRPGLVVGALLLACLIKGLAMTQGVVVPPDPDMVRDLGFIQGVLDGNWMGDPVTADAWRWYPPLLHGVAALIAGGLRLPLLPLWLQAGAWVNLLSPLMFYLMNRRLIGAWPAVAATSIFVLFDSVVMPGTVAASYTPWTLTPALAWPLFFAAVWLIAERAERFRLTDAALIGTALGLVFLAHTVPAVLLSGIVATVGLAVGGPRRRTLIWLAVVAIVQLGWSIPFLLPLIAAYRLHIANPIPGAWVHPALSDPATLLPNLAGIGALAWLVLRREWLSMPRVSVTILAAWIGGCGAFLGRHYACGAIGEIGGVCGIFVIAPHHYHAYLQAGWASLGGLLMVRLWDHGRGRRLASLIVLTVVIGLAGFFADPEDIELHRLGSTRTDLILDRAAYDWIIATTSPHDLFVTDLPPEEVDMGAPAAPVIAAGRRLVAPPRFHANPYVQWESRNARRLAYLSADADLCALQREAGAGAAFFLLPNGLRVLGSSWPKEIAAGAAALAPVFRSANHIIYRLNPGACRSSEGREHFL